MGFTCWRLAFLVLVGILSSEGFCISEQDAEYPFVKNATSAPPVSFYDYIIVGGGTAGCPLAATLSRHFHVLLLERGGSPYGNPNISNAAKFTDTLSDLSPDSASQRFISEDGVINARARVLGGGSCINAGFYTRASRDYVQEAGWDAALVNQSYEWVEQAIVHEPVVRQWQSAVRDGLLEAGVTPSNGFTYDHIVGTKVGGTIFDSEGRRHTAADLLQYAEPTRLTVLLRATVQRILFRYGVDQKPKAFGVVFKDSAGLKHLANLAIGSKNEIIISAGALGSPQLLMLSGIGPAEHLRSLGVPVVLDQRMVGQGMSDNPMNAVFVPTSKEVEISLVQVVGITSIGIYIESISGMRLPTSGGGGGGNNPQTAMTSAARSFGMFSPEIGQLMTLPPTQSTPEAIARAMEAMNAGDKTAIRGGFVAEKVARPLSTGYLELRSRDPSENPRVTFNYFQEPEDLRLCVEGMRTVLRVIDSEAFAEIRNPALSTEQLLNLTASFPVNLRPRNSNDSTSLEQYCFDTVVTILHYHGGCQVGRVVDPNYRVMGVNALRVIDGSTFNNSPGTNPQATVMMLGRYMATRIMEERLKKSVY